jgi:trigger factor
MNIARENVDALNAMLTVKVEKADYEGKVEATLRNYRRKAQVPGFRPGMAPMGLIKKMYQKSITADEVFKQMSEGVNSYIKDNHLHILGDPLPNEKTQPLDFDTQAEFEFIYDVAIAPEVQLSITNKIKIPYYTTAIADEELQKRIDSYRKYYGKTVDSEKIERDDFAIVDLTQSKENGIAVKDAMLSLKVIPEAEQQALLGLSVGESVEANVRKMLTNDIDCAAFLKITKEQLAAIDPVFTVTVKKITHIEPADVNQELFDAIYGKDAITSKEAFTDRVKSELRSSSSSKSEYCFADDVRDTLVKGAALELPEAFLKRWLLQTSDGKLAQEELDHSFSSFADGLRWQLIKEHILRQQNLEATEETLLSIAKKTVLQRLAMYGMASVNEDRLTEFANSMLNRAEDRKRITERAAENLVVEYVRNNAAVEQKKVSNEQLDEILNLKSKNLKSEI